MAIRGFNPQQHSGKALPRRTTIYEGRSKILCDGTSDSTFILYFKDNVLLPASDPNAEPVEVTVHGKGALSNRFSEMFMSRMQELNISSHYIKNLNMREQLVRAADPFAFHVHVHNLTTESIADRLGLEVGMILPEPLFEFVIKSKSGQPSIVSERHLMALDLAERDDIEDILELTQRINDFLCGQCFAVGLRLMNYKLEFGRAYSNEYDDMNDIVLIDEITPDHMELLDIKTGNLFGKTFYNHESIPTSTEISEMLIHLAKRFRLIEDTLSQSDNICR